MLSDLEAAMAMVEDQEQKDVAAAKDSWKKALEVASLTLSWPEGFGIQYNPAIWRLSRHTVGMRLQSYPWADVLIFEYATPNGALPLDCFSSEKAKVGVMLHEFGHLIDDARWGFNPEDPAWEAGEFITREQRAELLAFAACPIAVFEANLALVESTSRMVGVDLGEQAVEMAAIETMGHAGLAGNADPIEVLKGIQDEGIPVDRVIEGYLFTFSFSMAGLTVLPEMNESRGLGIKRSEGLTKANLWLCEYLRDEMDLGELQERLDGIDYFAISEEGHDPLSCVDFGYINRRAARENIAQARKYFEGDPCFVDLLKAAEALETKVSVS